MASANRINPNTSFYSSPLAIRTLDVDDWNPSLRIAYNLKRDFSRTPVFTSRVKTHSASRRHLARIFALAALCLSPVPKADAAIQYVIAISVDGLRGDYLQTIIDTTPASFPNIIRLRNSSAFTFNARCDFDYSETIPNHLSMVTGKPVIGVSGISTLQYTGFTANTGFPTSDTIHVYGATSGNNSGPYKVSIFDMIHDRGFSTSLLVGKTRLAIIDRSYNATVGNPDVTGADNGRDKIDFLQSLDNPGSALITTLTGKIAGSTLEKYTFLHIVEPDTAGHASGWSTTVNGAYWNSIVTVDGYLGSIFSSLDAKPALAGKYAMILTADHGGGVTGGGSPHGDATNVANYTIPFFLLSHGVPASSDLYAVFENRFNPGTGRPTTLSTTPPIRNADIANLSAELVGVPPVINSVYLPSLKKPVTVAADGSGNPTVNWPIYLTGWTLESCDDISVATPVWTTVSTGITETATQKTHTVAPAPNARFFRLKGPL